jgi:hypothetical protein
MYICLKTHYRQVIEILGPHYSVLESWRIILSIHCWEFTDKVSMQFMTIYSGVK